MKTNIISIIAIFALGCSVAVAKTPAKEKRKIASDPAWATATQCDFGKFQALSRAIDASSDNLAKNIQSLLQQEMGPSCQIAETYRIDASFEAYDVTISQGKVLSIQKVLSK